LKDFGHNKAGHELYRFQFKSYLPIAAKRGKALAPRFPQPLCQIGLNLESVLEAVFNSANAAFAVDFLQLFVGAFLLAFLASGETASSICEKSPRKCVIGGVEYSFLNTWPASG